MKLEKVLQITKEQKTFLILLMTLKTYKIRNEVFKMQTRNKLTKKRKRTSWTYFSLSVLPNKQSCC